MDLNLVLKSYAQIGYNYFWIILISFTAYFSATYAWKFFLTSESYSNWRLFKIRHIGEVLSSINPTSVIAGDGVKYYLLKDDIHDSAKLASSIMLSRLVLIISFLCLSFFSLMTCVINADRYELVLMTFPALLGLGLVLRFLYLLLSNDQRVSKWYNGLSKGKLKRFYKEKWSVQLDSLNKATSRFYRNHKLKFLGAFAFSIFHWILGAGEFMLVLHLLDIEISFTQALFLECGVVIFKNLLAFIPGQLGVEELGNKFMLDLIAIPDPTVWLSLSIIKRTRQLFWILIGVVFYFLTFKFSRHENIIYNT